jgi:hypothetical protein
MIIPSFLACDDFESISPRVRRIGDGSDDEYGLMIVNMPKVCASLFYIERRGDATNIAI